MNTMKKQEDMIPEDEARRLEGLQYAAEEEWRASTNSPRKKDVAGPKRKWHSAADVSGGESTAQMM